MRPLAEGSSPSCASLALGKGWLGSPSPITSLTLSSLFPLFLLSFPSAHQLITFLFGATEGEIVVPHEQVEGQRGNPAFANSSQAVPRIFLIQNMAK